MKATSKEMRKRQKQFPWLKTFMKEFLKTYPNCKKSLQCLVENIEKEIKELRKGHKQRTKALFETVKDLYRHFWWKIHWKQNSQWKNYWNVGTTHFHRCSEVLKCFKKLLNFLIHLGIILSQGASDSLWINRVLQAINILPVHDEIVFDAVLRLNSLKRKYRSSYMEILRHILCSEIILNISEPAAYVKCLMLFRRLKNFMDDEVAKASLISTASKIKPPTNLASWLSSLEISVDVNKSIVDQLFKKNSKQIFQKLYYVLIDSENSGSNNKEKNLKFKEKSNNIESSNEKKEENLFRMAIGFIDTSNKDINYNAQPLGNINTDGKSNQLKKVLHLPKLCNKIKNSKKKIKHYATNLNRNLVNNESNTKPKQQLMNAKTGNLTKSALDPQNISITHKKSKKKKKSKLRNDNTDATVINKNADTKTKKASKNKKSRNKSKKSRKRKKSKEIDNIVNVILDSKKSNLSNEFLNFSLETHSNGVNSSNSDDSVLVNSKPITEEGNQPFEEAADSIILGNNLMINEEKKSMGEENSAIKEMKLTHSAAENESSLTDNGRNSVGTKNCYDKISNRNVLSSKLPNLLANYEIYSSAEENEIARKDISSCPLVESGDNVLVPDTCQNDFNSIVPFNLDLWVPNKDDTSRDNSVSNDGSLSSSKYPCNSLTDIRRTKMHQTNQSDFSNSSFNDSVFAYTNDSEVSRDTIISNDGSQISDKYPYVSLVDVRKNKDWILYQNSDYSNSSLDNSVLGNINDSEMSQDTCISYGSQISDKNPYVSLIDFKKVKSPSLHQKSDNSSSESCFAGIINDSKKSQDTFVSNEKSQVLDKDPNNIKKVNKMTNQHIDSNSNYDPILGNVRNNEVLDVSNQSPNNSLCHDSYISENRNDESWNNQGENHHRGNENKDAELPLNETLAEDTLFQKNLSPCKKHSKERTLSMKRDIVSSNLETKINTPTKRKQKNHVTEKQKRKHSFDNIKDPVQPKERKCVQEIETFDNNKDLVQQKKRKCVKELETSDNNKDFVQPRERKCLQESETSADNVNGDAYLNDLSILLPNHGDIETRENETISPLNQSDAQDLSQFQNHNTLHEESTISSNELNGKQSASHAFYSNAEKQPCITFNENHHNNVQNCSIETVIDELIESELSKVHGSCNNLNSVRLSDNVEGNVHNISENAYSPFQTRSDLLPSDCFNYKSNLNTPQLDNNQSNTLSVSSTTENRSIGSEVARSLLNHSVNENSQRIALPAPPDNRKQNTNFINTSLNSGNSNFVIDCNIINDFDSRNSSRPGSSVSGDANTTTIKVILNLINAKPENASNPNPNSTGNGSVAVCNSSQGLHSSVASGQVMNDSNGSFSTHRNNSYFSEPPFFSRRTVNELDTPPDSESHLRIPSPPRVRNMVSSYSDDKMNFITSKSKGRSYTPENLSRKRQQNEFSHSSESANIWGINKFDLNENPNIPIRQSNSFSNTPSMQTVHSEEIPGTFDVYQKGNNHSAKGKQNKESFSRTAEQSTSTSKKAAFPNPRQKVPYRNSRPGIYSDESEDELSVSTMSLLSGEETDHSLIKTTDNEISPKTPPQRKYDVSKNKTRKLFREENWALDSPTVGSSVYEISTVEKPTVQKKKMQKKVVRNAKKPKTSLRHAYNLRSRNLLTPPTKLKSYLV